MRYRMKKICLLIGSSLMFLDVAYAAQVTPFTDYFDVALNSTKNEVASIITYVPAGHNGGIIAKSYYCQNSTTCHFETSDDNGNTSNGQVEFLIGTSSKDTGAPYCDIFVEDGAYIVGGAKATYYCYNGVMATPLVHTSVPDHQYNFNIVDQ